MFKNHLKSVLLCISKDETRASLCCVRFEPRRIVATDGHRLHIVELDEYGCSSPFLLHGSDVKDLFSRAKAKDKIEVSSFRNDKVEFLIGTGAYSTRSPSYPVQVDSEFPEYENVIQSESFHASDRVTIAFNPEYLMEACQAILAGARDEKGKPTLLIDVNVSEQLTPTSVRSGHETVKTVVMPMRADSERTARRSAESSESFHPSENVIPIKDEKPELEDETREARLARRMGGAGR